MTAPRPLVVATAGHVDHGKSTLVQALTGRDPDRLAEEQRRGLTVVLGFVWTDLPSGRPLAFVDVPGHQRFVPTMLSGAGPVPAVLFVVAADAGWSAQSAEHLAVLDALAVRHGLLAVTRSDLADPEPAAAQALSHLAGSSLGAVPWVAVSGRTGAGLDRLTAALDRLCDEVPEPDDDADVRLWVDRSFVVRGAGTVVTGTLAAGTIAVGDVLQTVPGRREVHVRGIETMEQQVDRVSGVSRVALNLRAVERSSIAPGTALVTPGAFVDATTVDLRLHGQTESMSEELTLHVGSSAQPAHVRPLGTDHARITCETAIPLHLGDRVLLRDPGRHEVAAAATVLDLAVPRLRRRGAAARRAAELQTWSGQPDAAGEISRRGLVRDSLLRAMGLDCADVPVRGWHISAAALAELRTRAATVLAEHQRQQPLAPGMPTEALAHAIALPDAQLVGAVLPEGVAEQDGRVGGVSALPAQVAHAVAVLSADLMADPWAAPSAARLMELGLGRRELAAAVRAGALLRVADGVYLLPGADRAAAQRLGSLPQPFTVSAARQALSTSRRVAVPLLELLDGSGRTERVDETLRRLR